MSASSLSSHVRNIPIETSLTKECMRKKKEKIIAKQSKLVCIHFIHLNSSVVFESSQLSSSLLSLFDTKAQLLLL